MENKLLKCAGYWALALILFVATLIIIRWTIDFVTWSTLTDGWAQVLGSVGALCVAIFVMSRQNAHAARLIVDADTLALRRRADAINAIVKRVDHIMELAFNHGSIPRSSIPDVEKHRGTLRGSQRSIHLMLSKLEAIPVHEFGSFDIVDSLFVMQGTLIHVDRLMTRIIKNPTQIGLPDTTYSFYRAMKRIEEAHQQFADGAKSFR